MTTTDDDDHYDLPAEPFTPDDLSPAVTHPVPMPDVPPPRGPTSFWLDPVTIALDFTAAVLRAGERSHHHERPGGIVP